ncbi:protein Spindly isoform X3 [Festucalex cinctus]
MMVAIKFHVEETRREAVEQRSARTTTGRPGGRSIITTITPIWRMTSISQIWILTFQMSVCLQIGDEAAGSPLRTPLQNEEMHPAARELGLPLLVQRKVVHLEVVGMVGAGSKADGSRKTSHMHGQALTYIVHYKSREVNRELQVHLETVLQQAQDPNSKGNSLFAELEDKRAEMERKLISMKVQYESLQAQYVFNKQQLQRMKVQIATLMQLRCSRADSSQLDRLQSLLSEKNDEIQHLMTKLQTLEKVEVLLKTKGSHATTSEIGNGQDETFYTDLLKMKLDNAIKDVERLGDELSLQRMKSLLESQKTLELERKLFTDEHLLKQAQCDKIKLQLQVEELQHKYEFKNKTDLSQGRKKEILPVDTVPFEGTTLDNGKLISKETDITQTMILHPETDKCPTGETGFDVEPKSAKRIRIGGGDPVLIVNASSQVTNCNVLIEEEHHKKQDQTEEREKKQNVEMMHISSESSMASQCSQQ